jgi:[methyl-Co(III) methanol-specific corrinoid protein]:coenzyme M methyltransferase
VQEAISLLKKDIGEHVVISGMIPGPFTLLTLVAEPAPLFTQMKRDPEIVNTALFHLSAFIAQVGHAYRLAGADYLTIHEMGGSPGFLGPQRFETFVLPALGDLIDSLPKPRVLSICGNTNNAMGLLAQLEAEAISVDQTNDLVASRLALPNTLLFGNIDPVETLYQGNPDRVREAVTRAKEAGVDALWPGCDLVPHTPLENLKAMLE